MLLASFFALATPASAGYLAWSGVTLPAQFTNQLTTANRDLGPVALSPNNNIIFAAVNDIQTPAQPIVYKSTDSGHTWVPTSTALGAAAGDIIIDLEVTPNYIGDNTVFVATQTPAGGAGTGIVYHSTDGGATFNQLGVVSLDTDEVITRMSVSPDYDGVGEIAVGIADIAHNVVPATAGTCVQIWGVNGALNWTNAGPAAAVDVTAIQYSPNYANDATLLAVTSAANSQPQLRARVGGTWDATITATNIGASAVVDFESAPVGAPATNLQAADIALPSNYDANTTTKRRAYVSIVGEAGYLAGGTQSNVYRVDNVTTGVALNPGVELWDLDYSGTYSSGTLFGGLFSKVAGNLDVYYTTAVTSTSPTWYPSTNAPTGTSVAGVLPPVGLNMCSSAHIDVAANFPASKLIVAGTVGTDSAFAVSTDAGISWNERGLIDNAGLALTFPTAGVAPNIFNCDMELSPNYANDKTIFLLSTNSSGGVNDTNVWRTTDGGTTFDRVMTANFNVAGIGIIAISQSYAANGVLYVGDTATVNLYYSNNKGNGWTARAIPGALGITIGAMAAPDSTTLYVGDQAGNTGTVAKSTNSGLTWAGANARATGSVGNIKSLAVQGNIIVAGDDQGTVWRSTDANASWSGVGLPILAGSPTFVAIDHNWVYAQLANFGDIYRWDIGTSTSWFQIATTPILGSGIELASDGTLYAFDPTAAANNQVYRSIDPELGPTPPVPSFEWMTGLAAVAGRAMSVAPGGSNTVVVLEDTTPGLWIYTDTLSKGALGATLLAPENGYVMPNTDQAYFSIQNVGGVTNWQLAFSNDPNFINNVDMTQRQTPPATSVFIDISTTLAGVNNEFPVYWKARATGSPLVGTWSITRMVIPQPQIGVNAPVPAAVATNLEGRASVTPVLNWTAFKNATGYQIQVAIAHSPVNFTEANLIVDEVLGPVTTYAITDEPLLYNQAYGWRVRALTAAGSSDWSGAVGFLTEKEEAAPTAQPTYTINVPTSTVTPTFTVTVPTSTTTPTTITPTWIYAIIVVGAVLVIAVIVLIVMTRK